MIVIETVTINNREFQKTYSDANRYVVRDGVDYEIAIDLIGSGRVYTEGNIIEEVEKDVLCE